MRFKLAGSPALLSACHVVVRGRFGAPAIKREDGTGGETDGRSARLHIGLGPCGQSGYATPALSVLRKYGETDQR
ncbi:hypothetical protein EXIGLDRAFT_482448 [Exidia glandulosa HHB12029]|uniref:Uncharacterized protein n=1 Tax=Exidia glandulosa HHB12029 TaxID=1314781 RepID=A0A165PI09_EXIGL|nr:hypothetical protein EXIGLDRAFT_482448 [Exidia glandulosa HHB12029]